MPGNYAKDLDLLRVFVVVVDAGSVTSAKLSLMRSHEAHPFRHTALLLSALTFFTLEGAACFSDTEESPPDPRLGREKKVRFASGCSSSVIMPVGGKETLTVQPAQDNGQLPADLAPRSSDPSVIAATPGNDPLTIDMQALKKGQADIELTSAGQRFDWLTFFVEPARAVKFQAERSVLAGGRLGLGVTDVFGACGTADCPLFGRGFIQWSIVPSGALSLLKDDVGIAHFTGGAAGDGEIVGKEPSEGGELLRHPVEIVDPTTITDLSGQLEVVYDSGDDTVKPVPLPSKVAVETAFTIRVDGQRTGKAPIAISRHDIVWTTPAGISLVTQSEPADTVAELFTSGTTAGEFTLTAKVALLGGREQSFVVTVVPAP
jgi:hypothetical protein